MPWKPIEIKAGDQSLVGKRIRKKNDVSGIVLYVGVESVLVNSCYGEYLLALKDFEIWEESKRWEPKDGEEYWYLSGCGSVCTTNVNFGDYDLLFLDFGNCFRAREHAKLALKYVKEALERAHEEIENEVKNLRN